MTGDVLNRDYTVPVIGGIVFIIGIIMWAIEGPGGYHLFPEEDDE
jgi:hypothetical protein